MIVQITLTAKKLSWLYDWNSRYISPFHAKSPKTVNDHFFNQ